MSNSKPIPLQAGTKLAELLSAIKQGATCEHLVSTLGWQRHTIRAAITRLRQRGYQIILDKGMYSLKPVKGKKS